MKNIKSLIVLLGIVLLAVSCQEKSKKKEIATKTIDKKEVIAAANFKKVALNITGMTCEIGCARTIQSKLSKAEGVKSATVNFEAKSGLVEYDASVISEKEIKEVVEQIAGGDLYKVTDIKTTE